MGIRNSKILKTMMIASAAIVPTLSIPFVTTSCAQNYKYFIEGESKLQIKKDNPGKTKYSLLERATLHAVDSKLVKWDFSKVDAPEDGYFQLSDDGTLSWSDDVLVRKQSFTIIAKYEKNEISLKVNVSFLNSVEIKGPESIYAFKNSRDLGSNQKYELYDVNGELVNTRNIVWTIECSNKDVEGILSIDHDKGTVRVSQDFKETGEFKLYMYAQTKDEGYKTTEPKIVNLKIYDDLTKYLSFSAIPGTKNASASFRRDMEQFPTDIIIPNYTDSGLKVTSLDDFDFNNVEIPKDKQWKINSIQFEKNNEIFEIGNNFFANHKTNVNLRNFEIDFSNLYNLDSIGINFLFGATDFVGLNSTFDFSERLGRIGNNFLNGCSNFNAIIDLSKTNIQDLTSNFMMNCSSFNCDIKLPTGLIMIGDNFLSSCSSYNTRLDIPTKVESIGNSFLSGCLNFNTSLNLNPALRRIGSYFLHDCESFNRDITIPSDVNDIGVAFMFNCKKMTKKVNIACSFTAFKKGDTLSFSVLNDYDADAYVKGIKVNRINADFFYFYCAPVDDDIHYRNVILEDKDLQYLVFKKDPTYEKYFQVTSDTKGYTAPLDIIIPREAKTDEGITKSAVSIGDNFFASTNIKSLYMPKTIQSVGKNFLKNSDFNCDLNFDLTNLNKIGEDFLSECHSFNKSLSLEKSSLTVIPNNFMKNDTDYASTVTLPNSINEIKDGFMSGCRKLDSIIIPENVNKFGDDFLRACTSLKNITFKCKSTDYIFGANRFADIEANGITVTVPTDEVKAALESSLRGLIDKGVISKIEVSK